MSEVAQTFDELLEDLNGHEEMAVAQHFGSTVADLYADDPVMLHRALVFVTRRRMDGTNDDDARNFALDMKQRDLARYFAEESEESGKDEPEPESPPEPSLSSVS